METGMILRGDLHRGTLHSGGSAGLQFVCGVTTGLRFEGSNPRDSSPRHPALEAGAGGAGLHLGDTQDQR